MIRTVTLLLLLTTACGNPTAERQDQRVKEDKARAEQERLQLEAACMTDASTSMYLAAMQAPTTATVTTTSSDTTTNTNTGTGTGTGTDTTTTPPPPPPPKDGTSITFNPTSPDFPTAPDSACSNWLNDWFSKYGGGELDWARLRADPVLKNLYYTIQNNCNMNVSCGCFSENTGRLEHTGSGLEGVQQCRANQDRCDRGTPGLEGCTSDIMWVIPGPGACKALIGGDIGKAIVITTIRQCGNRAIDSK